jgi:hypothetical protein
MSTLFDMLNNPNHKRLEETAGMNNLYLRIEDTLYMLKYFYSGKAWLESQSIKFKENNWKCYVPIATKKGEVYIGYVWERANMSNWLLAKTDVERSIYYPNLIWCDVGNHPYPKEIRHTECWLSRCFNTSVNKLVYPNADITKAVIFPNLIKPPLKP